MKHAGFWKGLICGILGTMITVIVVLVVANRGYLVTATAEGGLSVDEATEIVTKFDTLIRKIREDYLFEVDQETQKAMLDAAYKAFVGALGDKYSCYFTSEEYDEYTTSLSGTFGGVGITIRMDEESGYPLITVVSEDGPAAKSKAIFPGDLVYAADGNNLYGLSSSEVVSFVRGEIGTKVVLTVYHPETESTEDVTLVRKKIENETVAGRIIEESDRKIAYVYISEFDQITAKQFTQAVKELFNEEGAEALIIDVRNNPGGYLNVAVDIADALVPAGVVTYTLDKNGNRKNYTSDADCLDVPMVLLINGDSASAAEILTGALKDYKVATVIGNKTFGKGIVQNSVRFVDGSAIKLTVSRFYSPNGVCFHGEGIEPDWTVNLPEGLTFSTSLSYEQDSQLQAGVFKILKDLQEKDVE